MALFNIHRTQGPQSVKRRKKEYERKVYELKFFDESQDDNITPALQFSGGIVSVAATPGSSGRTGKQILVKELHIKLKLLLKDNTTLSNASDIIRFAVYLDKQCNGANPTAALLLTSNDIFGFRVLSNAQRFKTLYSCTYNLHATAVVWDTVAAATKNIQKRELYEIHLTNLNIPIFYTAGAGALTSIASNNIVFTIQSERNSVTSFEAFHRIRFYDM